MAVPVTRSGLIGQARSMAENWATQVLKCDVNASAVELEVCELMGISPPGATWRREHLSNLLPESFSLASSAPASSSCTGTRAPPSFSMEQGKKKEKREGKSGGGGGGGGALALVSPKPKWFTEHYSALLLGKHAISEEADRPADAGSLEVIMQQEWGCFKADLVRGDIGIGRVESSSHSEF